MPIAPSSDPPPRQQARLTRTLGPIPCELGDHVVTPGVSGTILNRQVRNCGLQALDVAPHPGIQRRGARAGLVRQRVRSGTTFSPGRGDASV